MILVLGVFDRINVRWIIIRVTIISLNTVTKALFIFTLFRFVSFPVILTEEVVFIISLLVFHLLDLHV